MSPKDNTLGDIRYSVLNKYTSKTIVKIRNTNQIDANPISPALFAAKKAKTEMVTMKILSKTNKTNLNFVLNLFIFFFSFLYF